MPPKKGTIAYDNWKNSPGYSKFCNTISALHKGKTISLKHKQQLREFAIKRFSDPLERKKISDTLTGRKGCEHTTEYKELMRELHLNDKNPQWKGDDVGHEGVHDWVEPRKQKPTACEHCFENKKLELHNLDGEYTRDLSKWVWLCRKCHMLLDGRLEKLNNYNRTRGVQCLQST